MVVFDRAQELPAHCRQVLIPVHQTKEIVCLDWKPLHLTLSHISPIFTGSDHASGAQNQNMDQMQVSAPQVMWHFNASLTWFLSFEFQDAPSVSISQLDEVVWDQSDLSCPQALCNKPSPAALVMNPDHLAMV